MEVIVHDIVRDAKIVPCYMSPGNIPLARVATQSLPKPAIITASFDAAPLAQSIIEAGVVFPETWVLIYDIQNTSWSISHEIHSRAKVVAREIHLFPTMVLLYQCIESARKHSDIFHQSKEFIWNITTEDTSILFTDPHGNDAQITLPTRLREVHCACGDPGVQRV